MNRLVLGASAIATALIGFTGSANAAPWQSINQREARLEAQIERGWRSGDLTRAEARRLSSRLVELERLEQRLRRGGLTMSERRLLDQRFDALARSVRVQKNDRQQGHERGTRRI